MKSKIAVAVFIVVVIVGSITGVKVLQIKALIAAGKSFVPPAETVSIAAVTSQKWQDSLTAIGSITAVQGVTVTPEVAGIVREITFESGSAVAKGDLLARLDTASEEAQLRAMEAQLELARTNLVRARELSASKMIPQSELDTTESTVKQTEANADVIRVTIQKKTIRAPFAGQLGLRMVNLGQQLDAGKPIVSLQSLAPVYAGFSLPQQDLSRLSTGMVVRLSSDAYPGQQFDGALTAINPDIDASTRSVGLQATFKNADQRLRPGMFVRAEVLLPSEQSVLAIPVTSVLSAPYGDSVYVVESKPDKDGKPSLTVRQQFIRTGRAHGDFLSVESGLKGDERIVSSALFKLRNGMSVVESAEPAPKSEASPHPSDN